MSHPTKYILDWLEHFCCGSKNATTAEKLAEPFIDVSPRQVNAIVRELREAGEHIGSGANGYYIIETEGEYQALIAQLDSRFEDLCALRKTVKRNYDTFKARQEAMF